ncbi:hypothetical protein TWF696_000467 [Orbilia brochopaga]|uniref:Uncharacterized protein n=1 Tax=Orbilia brochopaga TaxID=3140254 RepID=A0AAV9VBS7_9PEZI
MLKITIFGTLIVSAAALRSYGDRYLFYVKEPSTCGTGGCPTSTSYKVCGSGQCTEGACGNWIKGYNNYCCSVVHGTALNPNCSDPMFKEFFQKFDIDSTGEAAVQAASSCPSQTGFIAEGIDDPKGDTCCHLDKDSLILYQNATFPQNTEGDPVKARCFDPLVPIAAAKSSSSAPSPTSSGGSRSQSTGGPATTSSTGSAAGASTTPNAAPNNRLATAMVALPAFGLLALFL